MTDAGAPRVSPEVETGAGEGRGERVPAAADDQDACTAAEVAHAADERDACMAEEVAHAANEQDACMAEEVAHAADERDAHTAAEVAHAANERVACTAEEIAELLEKTSRTFALAIPLLPAPTDLQVGIAYLLFRIADTFEDAELWPRSRKLAALATFGRLLEGAAPEAASRAVAQWAADPPSGNAGYVELLERAPAVLGALWRLDAAPRRLIGEHTRRTVAGMSGFVERAADDGTLELADFADLRRYCYVVAGIVGEMLTELFLLGRGALAPVTELLRDCAARFGEALQLVNILKDSLADAVHGRRFLPASCEVGESMDLARNDLEVAARYTLALQEAGAPRGIVAFTALPLRLARATLELIAERGPGAKLSRAEVAGILASLQQALDQNLPAV